MKSILLTSTILCALASALPAKAYDPPASWLVHNRVPNQFDDETSGYLALGSISNVTCSNHGTAVTAATATIAAPPGSNTFGIARQATIAQVPLSTGAQVYYPVVGSPGAGYAPASPPTVTVAGTATTLPSCSASVAPVGDVWNVLGADGKSIGASYVADDVTPGHALWRRLDVGGLVVDAVGGTAPIGAWGSKRQINSYTGALFSCLPPAGGSTVDIPQDANGEADKNALSRYLQLNAATDCNQTIIYDQSGNGNNLLANNNLIATTINAAGSGYTASFTGTIAGLGCSAGDLPQITVTVTSNIVTGVVPLNVGVCPPAASSSVTGVAVTGGAGTGLTINATWLANGFHVSPQLKSGGILSGERISNSAVTTGSTALRGGYWAMSVAVSNQGYSFLWHGIANSAHQQGYFGIGASGASYRQTLYENGSLALGTATGSPAAGLPSSSPQTIIGVVGATQQYLVVGNRIGVTNSTQAAGTSMGLTIGWTDNGVTADSYMGLTGFVLWGRGLSATEATAARAAAAQEFNGVPQAKSEFVDHGDSRVEGAQSTLNQGSCQKLMRGLNQPSLVVYCRGWYGVSVENNRDNFNAQAAATINALAPVSIFLNPGSINNFGSDTAAQTVAAMQGEINQAAAYGAKAIYAATIYPKEINLTNYFAGSVTTQNAQDAYNASILTVGTLTGAKVWDQAGTDTLGATRLQYPSAPTSFPTASTGCPNSGTVTIAGGTLAAGAVAPTFSFVATSGVITSMAAASGGPFVTPPSNPATLTGSGCTTIPTFTLSYQLNPLISNDGTHMGDDGLNAGASVSVPYFKSQLGISGS